MSSSYTAPSTSQNTTGDFTHYDKPVQYSCGDCAAKVVLKRGDPIRCLQCGHRVLYKERTNKMVQFQAR